MDVFIGWFGLGLVDIYLFFNEGVLVDGLKKMIIELVNIFGL